MFLPVRIAYISYEYPPDSCNGGIATYVAQAARMMARRGHEVEVFAASPLRQGRYEVKGILEHWIKECNRQDFGVVAGHVFAARHAEKPFDVLEGPEYNADARKAVELIPMIPLVVKMHTPSVMIHQLNTRQTARISINHCYRSARRLVGDIIKGRPLHPFAFGEKPNADEWFTIEANHTRAADIVAPPCQSLCDYASKLWGIPNEKILLSPHPYIPTQDMLSLSPSKSGFTVGFVGRLERRKGIETLAASIPMVCRAVPQVRFRLIGASDCRMETGESYDKWLRSELQGFADHVEILGKIPLSEMVAAYDSLDICTFPSLWENFPNVCLEAMSAGRAVIASSAGGMAEMLDYGRVGRLIASGDPVSLAREIVTLLKSPAERIRLGELARQRVLEEYNENVIGEMMENIYREAIHRKTSA